MSIFMGVGVNVTSIIKWTLRIGLILFLIISVILYLNGFDIFTPLVTEHTTTTLAIVALGCMAFLPIIVPKPKKRNKNGGEEVMKKFHILIIAVIGFLVVMLAWLGLDNAGATSTIGGIGFGIGDALIGAASSINGFLGGFEPWQVAVGGIAGGIVFTYLMANLLIPKVKAKIKPIATPSYNTQPSYVPPTQVQSTPAPITRQQETSSE